MAKYQAHSVAVASGMKDISIETFQMIGKMDKASRKLSRILDRKIKSIMAKPVASKEDLHETDLLRKAVETLSAGKVQVAMKNYDLIDQNIKIVDHEIALLEKALIENGESFSMDDNLGGSSSSSSHRERSGGPQPRKRKLGSSSETFESNVDPNEPLYCFCNRIAFGDMIACDNEDCQIEW
eukprot:CAMPEP_0170421558 /NCGR_PEP_ID=MMETSP0117_2-20130122/35962_1 /TAXON_ID=400756 /ORGANISM="Durinskia baltica, Strain CSIRO CS-38" /LENGTH=181 /DNA_ID=CAMNT_0010680115 /DNA_START=37 /DNA_END=579 /DNA_ORIENTATION=+